MTKAAICVACTDIVAPLRTWRTDRSWRWCQCDHTGVRWQDGTRGTLEVTSLHGPYGVRVLGLNNAFLEQAATMAPGSSPYAWRRWHKATCEHVESHYLFHQDNRNCWAVIVRPGESGDVTFVEYVLARRDDAGVPP